MQTDDPDLPAFYFDPAINPIPSRVLVNLNLFRSHYNNGEPVFSHEDTVFGEGIQGDDELPDEMAFTLPNEIEPFFNDLPLENELTSDAISLWWAGPPYNRRSGMTRRTVDVPLIKAWYLEHCPPGQPVKVRVSYQKLLKKYVHNTLHARPYKAQSKKYLFRQLKSVSYTHL